MKVTDSKRNKLIGSEKRQPKARSGPRQFKFQLGYTLLELVVVVGILGALAVAATSLFLAAIRGGRKVDVTTEVKQNGQFAVSVFEQLTRNSIEVLACSATPGTSVTLRARDGQTLTFTCMNIAGGAGYIASNSARLTSDKVAVTACAFWCEGLTDSFRPPLVKVEFTLQQAGTTAEVSETATSQFSTSVGLRSF